MTWGGQLGASRPRCPPHVILYASRWSNRGVAPATPSYRQLRRRRKRRRPRQSIGRVRRFGVNFGGADYFSIFVKTGNIPKFGYIGHLKNGYVGLVLNSRSLR